jgi:hypothetical protein
MAKFKVGDKVELLANPYAGIGNVVEVTPVGTIKAVFPERSGDTVNVFLERDLRLANSCRSTNAVGAKALNACGTARNAFSVTQGDVNRMCNEGLQAGKKLIQHINEWMAAIRDYQRNPNLQDKNAEDEYEGTKGLVYGFKDALRAMGW